MATDREDIIDCIKNIEDLRKYYNLLITNDKITVDAPNLKINNEEFDLDGWKIKTAEIIINVFIKNKKYPKKLFQDPLKQLLPHLVNNPNDTYFTAYKGSNALGISKELENIKFDLQKEIDPTKINQKYGDKEWKPKRKAETVKVNFNPEDYRLIPFIISFKNEGQLKKAIEKRKLDHIKDIGFKFLYSETSITNLEKYREAIKEKKITDLFQLFNFQKYIEHEKTSSLNFHAIGVIWINKQDSEDNSIEWLIRKIHKSGKTAKPRIDIHGKPDLQHTQTVYEGSADPKECYPPIVKNDDIIINNGYKIPVIFRFKEENLIPKTEYKFEYTVYVGTGYPEERTYLEKEITLSKENFTNEIGGEKFSDNVTVNISLDSDEWNHFKDKSVEIRIAIKLKKGSNHIEIDPASEKNLAFMFNLDDALKRKDSEKENQKNDMKELDDYLYDPDKNIHHRLDKIKIDLEHCSDNNKDPQNNNTKDQDIENEITKIKGLRETLENQFEIYQKNIGHYINDKDGFKKLINQLVKNIEKLETNVDDIESKIHLNKKKPLNLEFKVFIVEPSDSNNPLKEMEQLRIDVDGNNFQLSFDYKSSNNNNNILRTDIPNDIEEIKISTNKPGFKIIKIMDAYSKLNNINNKTNQIVTALNNLNYYNGTHEVIEFYGETIEYEKLHIRNNKFRPILILFEKVKELNHMTKATDVLNHLIHLFDSKPDSIEKFTNDNKFKEFAEHVSDQISVVEKKNIDELTFLDEFHQDYTKDIKHLKKEVESVKIFLNNNIIKFNNYKNSLEYLTNIYINTNRTFNHLQIQANKRSSNQKIVPKINQDIIDTLINEINNLRTILNKYENAMKAIETQLNSLLSKEITPNNKKDIFNEYLDILKKLNEFHTHAKDLSNQEKEVIDSFAKHYIDLDKLVAEYIASRKKQTT